MTAKNIAMAVVKKKEVNFITPIFMNLSSLCNKAIFTDVRQLQSNVAENNLSGNVIVSSATNFASSPDNKHKVPEITTPNIKLREKALLMYFLSKSFFCTNEEPIPVSVKEIKTEEIAIIAA